MDSIIITPHARRSSGLFKMSQISELVTDADEEVLVRMAPYRRETRLLQLFLGLDFSPLQSAAEILNHLPA